MEYPERQRAVRFNKLPMEPSTEEALTHELIDLPPRTWCEHCVVGHGIDDPHRRRVRNPNAVPEGQIDYMFLGGERYQDSLYRQLYRRGVPDDYHCTFTKRSRELCDQGSD